MPEYVKEFQHDTKGSGENDQGFRECDRRFRTKPKIGHVKTESPVTLTRNGRSFSNGMGGHVLPEHAPLSCGVLAAPLRKRGK